jgi:subfamily B ATP-binding cassette protein HlyB/CyaB
MSPNKGDYTLPDGPPQPAPAAEPLLDSGLAGLVLIAGFHQIPVTPEGLRHQFAPTVKTLGEPARFGDQEILRAAKSLGFRAKITTLAPADLDNSFLPALAKDTSGEYFIIGRVITGTEAPSAVARDASAEPTAREPAYLIHNLSPQPAPQKLTVAELAARWSGQALLLTPRRSPFAALRQEFNLKWFIPSLVKYRRLFGEVLLASFLLQLFGLVTPLFFQVVMDKVLVHQALTTLDVLTIGFLAASFFEVILGTLRTYIFSHTTTRVDVELGARLFGHLLNLPLAWFQARQAGQSVARVRELWTVCATSSPPPP